MSLYYPPYHSLHAFLRDAGFKRQTYLGVQPGTCEVSESSLFSYTWPVAREYVLNCASSKRNSIEAAGSDSSRFFGVVFRVSKGFAKFRLCTGLRTSTNRQGALQVGLGSSP